MNRKPEVSAGSVRAATSVQACAAAPACGWPTDVSLRATSVLLEGISRWLRQGAGSTLWKAVVDLNCRFSKPWRAFVCSGKRALIAPGARGRHQESAPTSASRRNSLPPLSARASCKPRPRTVCLELTGSGVTREKASKGQGKGKRLVKADVVPGSFLRNAALCHKKKGVTCLFCPSGGLSCVRTLARAVGLC